MKVLVLLAIAAGLGALGYAVGPDIKRYLRMRSM